MPGLSIVLPKCPAFLASVSASFSSNDGFCCFCPKRHQNCCFCSVLPSITQPTSGIRPPFSSKAHDPEAKASLRSTFEGKKRKACFSKRNCSSHSGSKPHHLRNFFKTLLISGFPSSIQCILGVFCWESSNNFDSPAFYPSGRNSLSGNWSQKPINFGFYCKVAGGSFAFGLCPRLFVAFPRVLR